MTPEACGCEPSERHETGVDGWTQCRTCGRLLADGTSAPPAASLKSRLRESWHMRQAVGGVSRKTWSVLAADGEVISVHEYGDVVRARVVAQEAIADGAAEVGLWTVSETGLCNRARLYRNPAFTKLLVTPRERLSPLAV
jgi:hypothetical protein